MKLVLLYHFYPFFRPAKVQTFLDLTTGCQESNFVGFSRARASLLKTGTFLVLHVHDLRNFTQIKIGISPPYHGSYIFYSPLFLEFPNPERIQAQKTLIIPPTTNSQICMDIFPRNKAPKVSEARKLWKRLSDVF